MHATMLVGYLPVAIKKNKCQSIETLALIDSGAGGQFIHQDYVKQLGLSTRPLKRADPVSGRQEGMASVPNHWQCI